MKFFARKTALAMTVALLIAGGAATTASAYDRYDSNSDGYYDNDNDRSGDRYDNSYDNSYDSNDRYDNRYSTGTWDRDCDGVNDRYDRSIRDSQDADCDGISDRRDRQYDRNYSSRSHYQSYGSHRWSVGAHLPRNYYGDSYYVDYRPYGLSRPNHGYRWNRVGNDVYLVSTRSGLIVRVEYNVFR